MKDVENWLSPSLSAPFDLAANKSGAYQCIFVDSDLEKTLDKRSPLANDLETTLKTEECGTISSLAQSCVKHKQKMLLSGRNTPPPSTQEKIRPHHAKASDLSQNSSSDENSSSDATDSAKDEDNSSSSSDEVDENVFMENLVLEQHAASGELDTVEGVEQACMLYCLRRKIISLWRFCLQSYFSVPTLSIASSKL
jgi:hypothetical protein